MPYQHATQDDGREALFHEMMERLAQIQSKYRGVRGELLAKVREELMQLKPTSERSTPVKTRPAPLKAVSTGHPSCRVCGRSMLEQDDGMVACQNGHTRLRTV